MPIFVPNDPLAFNWLSAETLPLNNRKDDSLIVIKAILYLYILSPSSRISIKAKNSLKLDMSFSAKQSII